MKARKVAEKRPTALVLGCDQVLALDDETFAKPETPDDARAQLANFAARPTGCSPPSSSMKMPNRSGATSAKPPK
jgi:hypothetical protein